jgi:uncharacterized damage-inducible protein DinB
MSIAQSFLPEFDHEMANTRRTLERLPEDKLEYKPDPKSMSLGVLANHLAQMPGYATVTMQTESFDVAPAGGGGPKPVVATSKEEVLAEFDKNVAAGRAAIAGGSDESMMRPWSLLAGGNVVFNMPRAAVIRSMVMNHSIHHRAQLTVYYRLNGIPVPALYGPSADEGQLAPAAAAS